MRRGHQGRRGQRRNREYHLCCLFLLLEGQQCSLIRASPLDLVDLSYLCKGPVFKYSYIRVSGLQHINLGMGDYSSLYLFVPESLMPLTDGALGRWLDHGVWYSSVNQSTGNFTAKCDVGSEAWSTEVGHWGLTWKSPSPALDLSLFHVCHAMSCLSSARPPGHAALPWIQPAMDWGF